MSVNYLEAKPPTMDVVAPRDQQPVQNKEWIGHSSQKFGGEKSHIPGPVVDQNQPHPLYSMGGRLHFDHQNKQTNNDPKWKPSMKIGITPKDKGEKGSGVKHINYKPAPVKGQAERAHLRDAFNSLQGHTMDNSNFCMKKTEIAYKLSTKEYTQEGTMTQKHRVKTLYE